MKKLIHLAVAIFFVMTGSQSSLAKTFWRTFEVVEITSEGLVIQDFEGGRFLVNKDSKDLKVGDIVRYDTVKNRLKKSPWQPAKIIRMIDETITIATRSGENIDVRMRSKYRDEFTEGEQVHYNAAKGQLKKSNLQPLDEE